MKGERTGIVMGWGDASVVVLVVVDGVGGATVEFRWCGNVA
jgi:hypothetical protein